MSEAKQAAQALGDVVRDTSAPYARRFRALWELASMATCTDAETEADDLRRLDRGLMPLPDDEWSRGKCGMKALQYMGLGIPPVVSPVGVNSEIVQDGVNGFHAQGEREWVDRLSLLLRDAELRARLGARARVTIEERYSARVQAPRVARVFHEAARGARGQSVSAPV